MFNKEEFLEEYELSQAGINQNKRTIIIHIMYKLMNYELKQIDLNIVNQICKEVENCEFLFKSSKSSKELFEELDFNLYQCLNHWDDGFFDPYVEHFQKFLKLKLKL